MSTLAASADVIGLLACFRRWPLCNGHCCNRCKRSPCLQRAGVLRMGRADTCRCGSVALMGCCNVCNTFGCGAPLRAPSWWPTPPCGGTVITGLAASGTNCIATMNEGPAGVPGDGPGPGNWGWQSCTQNLHQFSARGVRSYSPHRPTRARAWTRTHARAPTHTSARTHARVGAQLHI